MEDKFPVLEELRNLNDKEVLGQEVPSLNLNIKCDHIKGI